LKTTVDRLEDRQVQLTVELSAEDVAAAIEEEWREVAAKTKISGFRKGKVPRPILEQRIGKEAVLGSVIQKLVPSAYPRAVDTSGIYPVDLGKVEVDEYPGEGPLTFHATIEIEPEASVSGYDGLDVTVPPEQATEDEIAAEIDSMRERFAKLEPALGRPVREGDFALIDFIGYLDGVPFDGGEGTDFLLEIGSGRFLPGFEAGLIGAESSEQREIFIDVPGDYQGAQIAGKRVKFDVTVKDIKEKHLPEATDEFVSQASEHDTLMDLRSDIRSKIENAKSQNTELRIESQLLDWLSANAQVEIPQQMIDTKRDELLTDLVRMVQSQGLSIDDYFHLTGQDPDALKSSTETEAEKRVREELALDAVARAEGLEVSDTELDDEIYAMAHRLQQEVSDVRGRLEERGSVGELRRAIGRRKALQWLVDHAHKTIKIDEPEAEDTDAAEGTAETKEG
jgi:trigger factor